MRIRKTRTRCPLLVLEYLLLGAEGGDERLLAGEGSVLREVQQWLAAFLFRP